MAGMFVMSASPSDGSGMNKETQAMRQALAEVFKQVTPDTLMSSITAELVARASQTQGAASQIIDAVKADARDDPQNTNFLDQVRAAVALITAKGAPEEVAAYKDMLRLFARKTAEAAKEDTFLGMGGALISPKEQAALDRLDAALA
jgi:hypothetical protein